MTVFRCGLLSRPVFQANPEASGSTEYMQNEL